MWWSIRIQIKPNFKSGEEDSESTAYWYARVDRILICNSGPHTDQQQWTTYWSALVDRILNCNSGPHTDLQQWTSYWSATVDRILICNREPHTDLQKCTATVFVKNSFWILSHFQYVLRISLKATRLERITLYCIQYSYLLLLLASHY